MSALKKLALGVATSVLAATLAATAARAQETTGGIDGTARGASGAPVANAQVTVVFEPTNQTFTTTTNAQGLFSVRQLPPGGPYRVTVNGGGEPLTQEVATIGAGAAYQVDLAASAPGTVSTVTVTGTRLAQRTLQTGPRSTFTSADVESLPSFSRDLKDIARLNPLVTLDPSNSNGLIIAGNNYRANTIYVDGVRQSDDFGLNGNGYPTQRSPLSIDLVQSFNVEVAPYDVSYGQFTGGVLNITTKSGGNDFHGTAYYEYDSDHLGAGKRIRDTYFNIPFKDKTYGFTIGGPILKDRLFFEFGYEKYEGLSTATLSVPSDATGGGQIAGVTTAQVQQIQSILQSRYGVAAGTYGASQPIVDEKFFGKLTLQLTDKHRLVFEAQSTDGQSFTSGSSSTAVALSSNSYILDQPLTSYSGYIYSNWTPALSTEISFTDRTVGRLPVPGLSGTPEFDVYLAGAPSGTVVYAGTNYSYQANYLSTESELFRARANYNLNLFGQHRILAGYEHEDRSATDLFIQYATGAYTFTSIANLNSGTAYRLQYANAASNVTADGVVPLNYTIHTAYLQDEWRVLSNLTVKLGLRDEYYEQGDAPKYNSFIFNTFGYSTTKNIDGLNVFMPRLGFNWKPVTGLTISGGVGRFSGGSPDVYLNNAFNGSGNILGNVNCLATTSATCAAALTNVSGTAIPASVQALNTTSANAGTGVTTIIAPNFQPPSVYKASISGQYVANFADWGWTGVAGKYIGDDWRFHVDYIHQWTDNGLLLKDLDTLNAVSGTAPDGRPIFNTARTTTGRYDLLLTNTHKGYSDVVAVGFGKSFDWGGDFDLTYTHTEAKDVIPFTSSVSLSNFRTNAWTDPNNPALAISNYSIPNQLKLTVGYERKFFGDYATRFRLFAQRRSGLPFSYVYNLSFAANGLDTTGFGLSNSLISTTYPNELIYVPKTDSTGNVTATSDPKVAFNFPGTTNAAGPQTLDGLNAFLKATGLIKYAGSVAPRDAYNSKDVTTVDLQFTQEIPAFFPKKARAELYFSIFNVGNLVNNSWGVLEQYAFPYEYQAINATIRPCTAATGCAAGQTNQYVYTGYGNSATRNPSIITTSSGNPPPSTWALKLGIRYKF